MKAFISPCWHAGLSGLLLAPVAALAEVVLDGSAGPAGSLAGPNFQIDEVHGSRVGSNLFHSFSQFDIASGQSATFNGQAGTQNVIGRITGGASQINGAVSSSIDGANLYLINPAGMVFGEGASVNVTGAFHASTADYLDLVSGSETERFLAAGGSVPRLLSAAPGSFGFLEGNVASINVLGEVGLNGRAFHFSSRNMTLGGGGQLQADAVGAVDGGDIHIDVDRLLMTGDSEISSDVSVGASGNAGDIFIHADSVTLRGNDSETPEISSDTEGSGHGGNIRISVRDSLMIRSDGQLPPDDPNEGSNLSGISTESKGGGGNAGNIEIDAAGGELSLHNGRIDSGTRTSGAGGRIDISANTVSLSGQSFVSSGTHAAGDSGTITIDTGHLDMRGESEIGSDVERDASGRAGNIIITADTVALRGAGAEGTPEISSDTEGSGSGGNIHITVRDSLTVRSDESVARADQAGIFTNSKSDNTGTGGASGGITIVAGRLDMNSGTIASRSVTSGLAGDVSVTADVIDLRRSAVQAESALSDGGNVELTATDYLLLRDSRLTSDVTNNAGGNLTIKADSLVLDDGALTATAGAGRGGNITVTGQRLLSDPLSPNLNASGDADLGGIDGTVEVNAANVDLSGSLEALETEFLDASSLLRTVCAARRSGDRLGSFTVVKQRGLPASAEGLPLFAQQQAEIPRARALSVEARAAMRKRDWAGAAELLRQAESAVDGTDVYQLIHLGRSQRLMAISKSHRNSALLSAHALLKRARGLAVGSGDARAESYALGNLAELYRVERRHRESLYLASLALSAAERAEAPESSYRWHWLSGRLLWAEGRASEALRSYRRAVGILTETRQEALVTERGGAFFRRSVAPVYRGLADALFKSADLIDEPSGAGLLLREGRQVMEQFRAAELRDYFGDPCIAELEAAERSLDEVSDTAAVVYPVPLRDRTELLVSTPIGMQRHVVEVGRRKLERTARAFRMALQQPESDDYLALGRQLHDWLIAPWLNGAIEQGVETLVLVPDGALRSIPLAALHDGERFLIERVAVAVAPGLDLVDPQPLQREGLNLLIAGVSESVQGYPAIPKVADELSAVAALHGGVVLLNGEFSSARIAESLAQTQPSIVHVASHAEFGGKPENSYLLTHDGRLSLAELGNVIGVARFREQPLELLVLSACQTAVGDDRAALGLAGAALQAGVRSVMGSLWSVSDEATYRLVENFYRALKSPELNKAAALQRAQRELLGQAAFAHPVYWAPFLMISNWL